MDVPGMRVVEGWVNVWWPHPVWLLEDEGASLPAMRGWALARSSAPDTTAVALVDPSSCLIVQPEDCLPTIEVPRGRSSASLPRPIQPAGEALRRSSS
jgi:hypothetical protein